MQWQQWLQVQIVGLTTSLDDMPLVWRVEWRPSPGKLGLAHLYVYLPLLPFWCCIVVLFPHWPWPGRGCSVSSARPPVPSRPKRLALGSPPLVWVVRPRRRIAGPASRLPQRARLTNLVRTPRHTLHPPCTDSKLQGPPHTPEVGAHSKPRDAQSHSDSCSSPSSQARAARPVLHHHTHHPHPDPPPGHPKILSVC